MAYYEAPPTINFSQPNGSIIQGQLVEQNRRVETTIGVAVGFQKVVKAYCGSNNDEEHPLTSKVGQVIVFSPEAIAEQDPSSILDQVVNGPGKSLFNVMDRRETSFDTIFTTKLGRLGCSSLQISNALVDASYTLNNGSTFAMEQAVQDAAYAVVCPTGEKDFVFTGTGQSTTTTRISRKVRGLSATDLRDRTTATLPGTVIRYDDPKFRSTLFVKAGNDLKHHIATQDTVPEAICA